jgi:hypothetical protein
MLTIKRAGAIAAAVTASLALAAGAATAVAPSGSGPSSGAAQAGGTLLPVPTNHVRAIGHSSVSVVGDTALVTVDATGLLDGVPHAMHIHIDGAGTCPTAAAARDHNGHRTINVADAMANYGMIGTSLTTSGDSSPASGLAVDRFPAHGTFHYERLLHLSAGTVANVKAGKAVVVVHGIDYNHNGTYDGVLGASELDPSLPAEATDPALCGTLHPAGRG